MQQVLCARVHNVAIVVTLKGVVIVVADALRLCLNILKKFLFDFLL